MCIYLNLAYSLQFVCNAGHYNELCVYGNQQRNTQL